MRGCMSAYLQISLLIEQHQAFVQGPQKLDCYNSAHMLMRHRVTDCLVQTEDVSPNLVLEQLQVAI